MRVIEQPSTCAFLPKPALVGTLFKYTIGVNLVGISMFLV